MRALTRSAFALSTVLLAAGIVIERHWPWLVALAANTALGVIAHRRQKQSIWMALQTGLAAASRVQPLAALAVVLLSLAYWDLAEYQRRLQAADQFFGPDLMIRSHFFNLLLALGSGSLLAAISFALPIRLSFAAAVLLAVVAAGGIVGIQEKARSVLN